MREKKVNVKTAETLEVWNSLKHLTELADFQNKNINKTFQAKTRGSIRDDFQVQMKTKEGAWQQIERLESTFNEIRLKHPIRYNQWISLLCLQKHYVLT